MFVKPNTTLIRLKLRFPDRFYEQDWYHDHEFANTPIQAGYRDWGRDPAGYADVPAVEHVFIWLVAQWWVYEWSYVWTADRDDRGDRVYVGKAGPRRKIQIHRHLTIREAEFANKMPTT